MKGAARRVVIEVVGWVLVVGGVAALVLPGPGLLMLFGGLAVLSQQYEWAEKRLDPIKYRALKGAAESVESPARIALSGLGILFVLACAYLWYVEPAQPGWWPLPGWTWLPGGAATSVTLVLSAVIAAALLAYSYRRFHGRPDAVADLEREIDEADEEYRDLRS